MTLGQRIAFAFLVIMSWLFFIGAANGARVLFERILGW